MSHAISGTDRDILRRLAERKLQFAADPINEERRNAWLALDAGSGDRVMVLAEDGGIRDPRKPCSTDILACADEWARRVEAMLRREITPPTGIKGTSKAVEINDWNQ